MASRRDQFQSYQFLVHRVISALVMRETDPAESPLRRGVGAIFAGLMVTVIVAAGFGVYGLITKIGSSKWQVDGEVVIEKETGAVFVYQTGTLYPMINYASALLASGHTPPTTASVSRNSLSKVHRGDPLGIPNAPNSLPDQGSSVGMPWSVCSVPHQDTTGALTASTVLLASLTSTGRQLPDSQAVLVRAAGQNYYLVYHGYKYPVHQPDSVLRALYGNNLPTSAVGVAWLNTLPEGQPIEPIDIGGGVGNQSPAAPDYHIGDLLKAQSASSDLYYLVFDDGYAAISELQKDIYIGLNNNVQIQSISLVKAQERQSNHLRPAQGDEQPPASPPRLYQPGSSDDLTCTVVSDATATRGSVWVGGSLPSAANGNPTPGSTTTGGVLADRVVVPAGKIVVARIVESPTATSGAYALITDTGVRYPVVSDTALATLGYAPAKAVDVPSSLANLVPTGPTLDPNKAKARVDMTAQPRGQ
jgi:type VII secretion protein EccB